MGGKTDVVKGRTKKADSNVKTHNAPIYHCITCGRVVHAEAGTEPPRCCGHTMVNACSETIRNGDVGGDTVGGQSETASPAVDDRRKKPR